MAASALVVSLALMEAAARHHDGSLTFPADGRRFATVGGAHGTNSLGFHERELPLSPPAGVRRVVVLGDSMTWGTARAAAAWPRRAEAVLGDPWQFVNLSHYGYDAAQSIATLHAFGWDYQPELVIFASYVNDLVPTELITVGDPPLPAWVAPEGWLPWSLRRWSALARLGEGAARRPGFAEAEDPAGWQQAIASLRDEGAAHHVPVLILGLVPHVLAETDPARCDALAGAAGRCGRARAQVVQQREFAEPLGLPFVSMADALSPAPPEGWFPENRADWEHPSPAGHRRLGEAAALALRPFLP